MTKQTKIILGLIGLAIIIILAVNFTGYWPFLNTPLNIIIAGTPDQTCLNDYDCQIAPTKCSVCDCGQAVNKEWQNYCPFKDKRTILCKTCVAYTTQCIEGQCQRKIILPER